MKWLFLLAWLLPAAAFAQFTNGTPLSGTEVFPIVPGSSAYKSATANDIKTFANTGSGSGLGTPVTATATGTTQGTAKSVTSPLTVFTSVPASSGGILTLPYSVIMNAGSNTLTVYPNSGATITGGGTTLATNAGFSIAAGSSASFACSDATHCYASFSSFQ